MPLFDHHCHRVELSSEILVFLRHRSCSRFVLDSVKWYCVATGRTAGAGE
ncbi:hypothetical protein IL54_0949 [Sphingobium sp. ba1]|nr:hypothetical protein IL54_0949 [Sphingobium sp. ba1]